MEPQSGSPGRAGSFCDTLLGVMDDKQGTFQAPNGDAKIGQTLEKARKEKGLSLDEVEHATKIRKRYLAGLEREDFGALPDAVYARGFLKTYANYLGLDGEELSRELRDRKKPRRERGIVYGAPNKSDFDRPLINPGELSASRRPKSISGTAILTLIIGLLALVAVAGALYYVGRGVQLSGESPGGPPPPSGEQAADEPGANAPKPQAGGAPEQGSSEQKEEPAPDESEDAGGAGAGGAEPQPDTLTVEVSVEGTPSWLSILADGSLRYEQIAQPGFSQTFEAQREISIRTGNAGAVGVEVNGQDLGKLGESGEVLTRNFTLKTAT
jgi:cytoskeleton protein RodZ